MLAVRYLFREIWPRVAFIAVLAWVLFAVLDGMESARWLANGTVWQVVELYLLRAPSVLLEVMPVAVVLGVLSGMGALMRRGELTALQAGGRALGSVALPAVLAVAGGTAVIHAATAEWVVPAAGPRALDLYVNVFNLLGGRYWEYYWRSEWFRAGPILARTRTGTSDEYENVTAVRVDDHWRVQQRIRAARLVPAGGSRFTLYDASLVNLDPPGHVRSEREEMDIPQAAAALSAPMGYPEHYTLRELQAAVEKRAFGGRPTLPYMQALVHRILDPVLILLLGVLAVPLARRQKRDVPVERLLLVGGATVGLLKAVVMLSDTVAGMLLVPVWVSALLAPGLTILALTLLWPGAEGARGQR